MTSDVVLSAALRTNLLALQKSQNQIDITQNRLATGRKINSALDGPQSFFASQALNNRASDLTRLLDSIGQSIQVIKAADNGVTALTRLVEQADAISNQARDALAQGQSEAKVVGNVDLRGINDLTTVSGLDGVGETYTLTFSLTDTDGDSQEIGNYNAAGAATVGVNIAANQSIEELIGLINDIRVNDGAAGDPAIGQQAFEASLDSSGRLQIRSLNGGDFSVNFTSTTDDDPTNFAAASALGFGEIARIVRDGAAASNNVQFSAVADVALRSFELTYTNGLDQDVALRSTLLSDLELEDGTPLFAGIGAAADEYVISINGGTEVDISLVDATGTQALTVQGFIDAINSSDTLNSLIRAEFDDVTGQISIVATDASVQSIEIGVNDAVTANFGFGLTDDPALGGGLVGAAGQEFRETIRIGAAAAELAALEDEFDNIREQITQLVSNGDTGYRGTNLLNGDDLLTTFNEFRTSSLTTEGVTFDADGLGLDAANFSRVDTVEGALSSVREALETVRNFGSTLANDLSIVQTRQDFITSTINTLTEGASKLVDADQNEEGAKLLALQTRQALGVTALSLASQSQQSILRLF